MAQHEDQGRPGAPDTTRGPAGAPEAERRASHRVKDDQKTGQGSLSALSKLKMIERKRAAVRVARDDE